MPSLRLLCFLILFNLITLLFFGRLLPSNPINLSISLKRRPATCASPHRPRLWQLSTLFIWAFSHCQSHPLPSSYESHATRKFTVMGLVAAEQCSATCNSYVGLQRMPETNIQVRSGGRRKLFAIPELDVRW